MWRVIGVSLCVAITLGCNTVDSRLDAGYQGPRVYSGTRRALSLAGGAFFRLNPPEVLLWAGDAVLCSAADTLLLPITIPEQIRRNERLEQSLRTDIEQPGVLREIGGERPINTAKRLFRECSSLVLNVKPQLTDCYSIEAKIELEGGEELSGAQYKEQLRSEFLALGKTGRFVRLVKPEYEEQGQNIAIDMQRLDSDKNESKPLHWLVGPGTDGQWRILEERGPGFD